MAIAQNFPAIAPSLSLDFAAVQALDPRITFTRASTATYYGTETAKAEENLLIRSQEFDTTAWIPGAVTRTANSTSAPDGTTTADTITAQAAHTGVKVISQVVTTSTATYTYSVFAKKDTHDFVQLKVGNNAGAGFVNFDLNLGTLSATTATGTITDVGNGWYRCTMTAAVTVTNGFWELNLVTSLAAVRSESWTSVGTEAVFLWGAQLEQRSAVTNYTPTTTQPITNYIPVLESAASGVARFDHNPNTFESLGLLIEEQRTNLVVRSEEFDNASWQKVRCSAQSNVIIAPNGTLTGDKIVESTDGSTHALLSANLTISSSTHTGSCYLKAGERTYALLGIGTTTSGVAYFDLEDGVVGTVTGGYTATITPVGNDWYRCSVTGTIAANGAGALTIYTALDNNVAGYTGDGFSGIFIWGAQLESSSFSTSYIPTSASQVTRAADAASMTGANFSSWYRPDQGTLYLDAFSQSARAIAGLGQGTFATNIVFNTANLMRSAGSTVSLVLGTAVAGSVKLAGVIKPGDFAASANGAAAVASTQNLTTPFAANQLQIGASTSSGTLNGTIKKLAYYPVRIQNSQLQALTS